MPRSTPARSQRLAQALTETAGRCMWCGRPFGDLVTATTDHLVPRVKGGPSWPENEVPACRRCNGQRGHQSPADWAAQCLRRGWQPDLPLLRSRLLTLQVAIGRFGGQRRARPYVVGQLRRLPGLMPSSTAADLGRSPPTGAGTG